MNVPNVSDRAMKELQTGSAIIKLENDQQMMIAIQQPRSLVKIRNSLLEDLDNFPRMAHDAIYRRPVGKSQNAAGEWIENYAEGLSIRAAEHVSAYYNNAAIGVVIVGEDEDSIQQCASFLDYERNIKKVIMKRTSKWYRDKKGGMKKREGDRLTLATDADRSKLFRECVMRAIPAPLRMAYEEKAREIRAKTPIESRRSTMIKWYASVGITQEMIEEREGKAINDFGHTDIDNYVGLANAIRSNEISVSEIFNIAPSETEQKEPEKVSPEVEQEIKIDDAIKEQEVTPQTNPADYFFQKAENIMQNESVKKRGRPKKDS